MSQTRAQLVKGFSNTSASDDAVTVDSNGNVGIGVTPNSWGGSRNAIQFDSAGAAYVCNDTTVGIVSNMYFDGSNNKYINAGTASSAYFQQDNVVFQFAPSGSADGNGTFTTSTRIDADGVKFGSDTAAANALDDYEEGTWIPKYQTRDTSNVLHDLSGSAYSRQTGSYCKVGRLVFVRCRVTLSTQGTATAGQVNVANLPFTVNTVTDGWTGISLGFSSAWTTAAPQACLAVPGGNELQLYFNASSDSRSDMSGAISQSNLSNTADVILAGTYFSD